MTIEPRRRIETLVVEDDPRQREMIIRALRHAFPEMIVTAHGSEHEFLKHVDDIDGSPPDYVVMDLFLRWHDSSAVVAPAPHDPGKAGFRCIERLRANSHTKYTPVILYTVVAFPEAPRLPDQVYFVHKEVRTSGKELVEFMRSLLRANPKAIHTAKDRVFVVHGHDREAEALVARLLDRAGMYPVIFHELALAGQPVITSLLAHADVDYAVVVMTPDDFSVPSGDPLRLSGRARQNVIFELGFFIGRLGLDRVCALVKEDVVIPSDYAGVLYIKMDTQGAWESDLLRQLDKAGLRLAGPPHSY